ncbi:MAG: RNA 2',3'-cyclic phosphodiesterase [Alphaproteobacteria bacterium]|nr:RNA 2',3'-cyclic phosphodiesterase [Alphaproteobacteria bacterium]
MLRLFVGLPIPTEARVALTGLCCGLPGARWVSPENFHVTLRFIGEVPTPSAEEIDAELARIRVPAFTLSLRGIGHFGKENNARTLYADMPGCEPLSRLQAKVDGAVARCGHGREARKFHPHVTLARLRGTSGPDLREFEATYGAFKTESWPADRFILYRSLMGKGGSVYEELAEYPLAGAYAEGVAFAPDLPVG